MVELLRSLLCGVFRRADSSESSSRGGTPGIVIAEPRQQQQPRWSTINHHHHHSSVVVASSSDPSPLHQGLRHRIVITATARLWYCHHQTPLLFIGGYVIVSSSPCLRFIITLTVFLRCQLHLIINILTTTSSR